MKELKIIVPGPPSGLGIISVLSYQTGKSNGMRSTGQSTHNDLVSNRG